METEKLLKQAKFLYPVGTEFKNAVNKSTNKIVPNKPVYNNITSTSIGINGFGWLLYDGVWAEVISRPEEYVKVIKVGHNYSGHKLASDESILKNNKTYRVKDRIIFGIENPYGTYVIEADGKVFVIGHKGVEESTKEQFDKDWNEVKFPPPELIKQKPMEKKGELVVHVPYIEMYNFVKDNSKIEFDNYDVYGERTCLMPNDCSYSDKEWFKNENYKITTFKDWLKQTNNESKWQDYLFELAKKRYPIGCTISSLVKGFKEEIVDYRVYEGPGGFWLIGKKKYNLRVYENGKWADFTEPEVKGLDYPLTSSQCFQTKSIEREYYIPKQEVKQVKKLVQYVPIKRSKSINKY